MADNYTYYVRWGEVVGVERAPEMRYDPRQRPWYRTAIAASGVAISSAYVFSGTNRPGITLSRQIRSNAGAERLEQKAAAAAEQSEEGAGSQGCG